MVKVNYAKELSESSMNPFDVCKDIAANKFGYGLIVRSDVRVRAPKATAKEWFETFGTEMHLVKITKVANARAYDYVAAVKRQLEKSGESSDNFVGEKMKGYEWLIPNILKSSLKEGIADKDRMQFCLTYKDNDKTTFERFYIVGGDHFATQAELDFIQSHLYVASKSKKQTDLGIDPSEVINVRNYKVSNVVKCGKMSDVAEYWKLATN